MYCVKDLEACRIAMNNSKSLRHITLFACFRAFVAPMDQDQFMQEVTFLAPQIESLRLYGYIDSDSYNMGPYLLALSTLSIHTLELVRMDLATYSLAVQTMSIRKSSEIKTLFFQPFDEGGSRLLSTRSLDRYLEAFSGEELLSQGLNPLPKLDSIIIQKVPTARNDLTISVDQVVRILAPRMGVLKRLILPQNLDPGSDPKGDAQAEGSNSALVRRLTDAQVQYISRFGEPEQHVSLMEMGFSFEVDHYGLDVDMAKLYYPGEAQYCE
ncbi:hypothetical protein DL93DRAFT_2085117 [Clavulina sp. PMI_390]|nr:hypothetical protein DL93DRAFT_2085117 [Clavulina sp. PMI_390]